MEQSYNSNFNKLTLLFCDDIYVDFDQYKILLKIPSIKEWLNNEKYSMLISSLKDQSYWSNELFKANNRIEFICGLNKFGKVYSNILEVWDNIFPNLTINPTSITCNNIKLDVETFDLIFDMLLVGCGLLSFEDYTQNNKRKSDDELEEDFKSKLKKYKEKLDKIKSKDKKAESYPLEKMFICILSYFPQYNLNNIRELNYFSIYMLFEYAKRRSIQSVTDIAYGSGNLKKYEPIF